MLVRITELTFRIWHMNLKPGSLKDFQVKMVNLGKGLTLVLNQHREHIQSIHLVHCFLSDNAITGLLIPLIHLKTLVLTDHSEKDVLIEFQDGLQRLLHGVPNLGGLKISLQNSFWFETLQTALNRGCLQFLEELSLVNHSQSNDVNEEVLTRLLKAVPKSVRRLRLGNFYSLGIEGNNTLRSLAAENPLTSLKVHQQCGIESKTWQKILATCRFLVDIGSEWVHDDIWMNADDMTEPWICLDLEVFALNVKLESGPIGVLAGQEVMNRCGKLFLQLATLRKLKRLQMKLRTPPPNG